MSEKIFLYSTDPKDIHNFSVNKLESMLGELGGAKANVPFELDRKIFLIIQGGVMAELVRDGILNGESEYGERRGSDIFREMWKKGMPNSHSSETYGQHAIFLMQTVGVEDGMAFLTTEMKKRLPPRNHAR